ncbi:TetR/AcrR family transcriptional regulator [Pseudonocardia pini]|uniref:TetR/AcrR family transcriptional regulator n=1 Tax=Pseudonocardia pini TaxID=2758030 RepID=UPI0015F0F565|nr:TetR/AcrR family transcriptional regulator [Pseudonocardia pini]
MSDGGEILRRDGYWPSSPVVGQRGAQTRERIVTETLRLFERQGFHGTSVEAIATAAGTSRATLYQYFESKEQIFVELLEECGAALMRVVRRLGPLGPTPEGFDNLHWWLGEWAWVYDKYATMFVQWASIDTPDTAVRPLVIGFVRSYNSRITQRLVQSGVEGMDPDAASLALTSLVHRFNYLRHRGAATLPRVDECVDGLAVTMQLMLFPESPPEVFAQLDPVPRTQVRALPTPATIELPATDLSARAAATVEGIMGAGARLFAARGYHGTGVDELVAEAGFARATFYKYFDDKLDLLRRLSAECQVVATELSGRLAALDAGPESLRGWLRDFVPFHRRYLGVFRAWVEGTLTDPALVNAAENGQAQMHAAAVRVLAQVERDYPLDLDVAAAVFEAVLDRLPEAVGETAEDTSDAAIVDLMVQVIERGLLSGSAAH